MSAENNESRLIKRLIEGDAYAFDEIYNRFNVKVYSFSLKNLQNKEDAEGVVQEVFMNLWKERDKLRDIKNLDAWIFGISFNIIRKCFRRLARERDHLKHMAASGFLDDNTTVTEIEYNDLLKNAERIIEKLPCRQKTVFLLSKKDGLSNTEISRKLNISRKTVENHLSAAKAFLTKAFNDEKLLTMFFFWLFIK